MARQQKLIHLHGNSDFNQSAVAIDKGEIAVEHGTGAAAVKLWTLDNNGAKVAFMSSAAVNTAVADALKDAQEYADQAELDAIASAKTYTDTRELVLEGEITAAENRITALEGKFTGEDSVAEQIADALASANTTAKGFADDAQAAAEATAAADATSKANKALEDAQAYADQAEADAISAAAADATTKANKALKDAQEYADQAELDAIASAKTYTDTKIAAEVTRSNNYADAAEAAAIASAKTYTDAEVKTVNDALTEHTSNGDIHVTKVQTDAWQAATNAINAFMDAENVGDAVVNTLKEIQDYITSDGAAADEMTKNIAANKTAIETEASTREAADNALGERLDVLEGSGNGSVAKALADAKAYADAAQAAAEATAAADAKTKADDALASAKTYADGLNTTMDGRVDALEAKLGEGEGSVSVQIADAIAAEVTRSNKYADDAEADAISTANSYTDTKIAAEVTRSNNYADAAEAAAIASAKTYTDGRETAITTAYGEAIKTAIENLDAEKSGQNVYNAEDHTGTNLKVTVTQVDGKITAVAIDDSNLVIDCGEY